MIPLYKPLISKNEIKNVNACLKSSWISSKGIYIKKFEKKFSNFTKIKYSISVSNGTCAIHLALVALGVKKNDEVIVPSFTYVATVNPILYTGAKPIFADSNIKNFQLSLSEIKKKITKNTKAIICPHLYGNMTDMQELYKITKEKKIFLIEDCAEAIGSYYKNKHAGNFGDIATFSFYGNKTISTGEGGMVCTNNKNLARMIYKLKTQGLASEKKPYYHDIVGFNYRMTNICAAIGYSQMLSINKILRRKKKIFEKYESGFKNNKNILILKNSKYVKSSYWLVVILIKKKIKREKLVNFLNKNNIDTRPTFFQVHKMPMYSKKLKLINGENLSANGICLPSFPQLKNTEIKYIIDKINYFLK